MIGTSLGPYEIIEQLGAGGMGEVYRARDTKLERDVAVKVLPDDLAADPDRLARFEREAKLLAALNHANIGAIHGLEDTDGVHFLVLELIEGESLEQRLRKGAIPVPEALDIARQIAEALEAAHDAGIIHRDVKPANVLLTARGGVKVLDFGIAKSTLLDGAANAALTEQATSLTVDGTLMGTPPYMSPEQIRGEEADKRADIWAFGCVVYEMLTGTAAFARETVADTLVAVLEAEPDWQALPATTHDAVGPVLRRCLRKDPNRRLRDVADARIEIEDAFGEAPATGRLSSAHGAPWRVAVPVGVAAVLVVVALVLGAWVAWWTTQDAAPSSGPFARLEFDVSDGVSFPTMVYRLLAVSPDGINIAFVDGDQLWLRALGDHAPTPFADARRWPHSPFFSPDGGQIGFMMGNEIRRIAITGGAPETVAPARGVFGASWAEDGMIYYGRGPDGIWRVPEDGNGEPEPIITLQDGESAYGPQLLPGGNRILFTLRSDDGPWNDASIVVQSLDSDERHAVVSGGTDGRYVATGHVVYHHNGSLFAVPFNPDGVGPGGEPSEIETRVRAAYNDQSGAAHYDVSANGTLVFISGDPDVPEVFVTVDADGEDLQVVGTAAQVGRVWTPRYSPAGTQIAYQLEEGGDTRIWVLDLERQANDVLTPNELAFNFAWAPDGSIYYAAGDGRTAIRRRVPGSRADPEELHVGDQVLGVRSISRDGRWLLYTRTPQGAPNSEMDVWLLDLDNSEPRPFLADPSFGELSAFFSPNGQMVASLGGPAGYGIYVQPFPDGEPITQVARGREPRWSPDGDRIYYRSATDLMVVDFDATGNPRSSRVLIPDIARPVNDLAGSYDIHPEGTRFLFREIEVRNVAPAAQKVNVVLNWFEELKRLVPTDGSR